MATTAKLLGRGSSVTGSATAYTTPASTTTVVTSIILHNTSSGQAYPSLTFNGVKIYGTLSVNGYDTLIIDCRIVLSATQTILVGANSGVFRYHISGVEIT